MVSKSPNIQVFNYSAILKGAIIDLAEFALFRSTDSKRETEKQAALYLIRQVLANDSLEIQYEKNGRPYLGAGPEISISHTADQLIMLFSYNGKKVGVDIEKVREKVLNIKEKFLSKSELLELEGAGIEKFTLYWAVKEAVYKASCLEGLLFAEEINVKPFDYSEKGGSIYARVNRKGAEKEFTLHYQLLNGSILAYTDNGE